jgi:hypothetical protein
MLLYSSPSPQTPVQLIDRSIKSINTPSLHEIHKIKETLLIPPLLRRAIHSLNPEMLRIIPKLPVIRKRPSVSPHNLHAVLPDRLQDLGHEGQVVLGARGVEELVREVLFVVFAKDGEAELGYCDGGAVDVVQEVEVEAQVGRGDVDV